MIIYIRDNSIRLLSFAAVILLTGCSPQASPVNAFDLQIGESVTETISTHCGYEWLEVDINGQTWRSVDIPRTNGNRIEPTWPNGFQQVEFEFILQEPGVLEVRATSSDISYSYAPVTEHPGCA